MSEKEEVRANARQVAFLALRAVLRGAFADVALDRLLQQFALKGSDRRLATELVYGSIRRQRTLDALIDQLGKKKAQDQPPDLRLILHLGLYQLRYLNQIPVSAAVDTAVELSKQNGLSGLAGFVNGLLRQYVRLAEGTQPGETAAISIRKDTIQCAEQCAEAIALDPLGSPQMIQSAAWQSCIATPIGLSKFG
ncbi:MAG: hypothetical protein HC772_11480 [Leptolyngbyaceae cyanobacterium CRU_2_3]|nr:hypothetical protein [Leptolyngbyaceae cyanobacterium CRU_2_3]